ncbi:MAG: hypothetical protein PHE55_21200 [Methylococcaceae bacterium]|nr:hypothetical protein [Methylococcaceae bacterium]
MGVGYAGLQFLLYGKNKGINYESSLTLGRQCHYLDEMTIGSMFSRFRVSATEEEVSKILKEEYSDELFKFLGAKQMDSMDASPYESANIIFNLNKRIDEALCQKYSVVVDFGTLEHVFNFPMAIRNVIDMIQVGGHFLSITTANNFMGHGFYQFSPELFFNVLGSNGFSDIDIFMAPAKEFDYFFRVVDPRIVNRRVEIVNHEPIYLFCLARRERILPEFVEPIQSDYEHIFWKGARHEKRVVEYDSQKTAEKAKACFRMAAELTSLAGQICPDIYPGFENPELFIRIDPAADLVNPSG